MPETSNESHQPMVQGSAVLFSQSVASSQKLHVQILKQRHLSIDQCSGCFIENTNLNKLPPNCLGVLVAFSNSQQKSYEKKNWTLGIIIHLHPDETVIAPCTYAPVTDNVSPKFIVSDDLRTFRPFSNNDPLTIVYLNSLHNNDVFGPDGFIDSSIYGPDVPFKLASLSSVIKISYYWVTRRVTPLFKISSPKCYSRSKVNPFKGLSSLKLTSKRRTNVKHIRTIRVAADPIVSEPETEGYAFPYIDREDKESGHVSFAFLNHDNSKFLISYKELDKDKYNTLLDSLGMYSKSIRVESIDDNGLAIEDDCESILHESSTMNKISEKQEPYQRRGILHGLWMPCDTFECEEVGLLEYVLHRTYGNFGFLRNKTTCFGLNAYTGKKNAKYVRPSPKMSKQSTTFSEYYRETFDPTFHPLVYKMLNELSNQAGDFQKHTDPVYDRFLFECFNTALDGNSNYLKGGKRKAPFPNDNAFVTHDNLKFSQKFMFQRRFAALSILTCGNQFLRGFANMGHVDADVLDNDFHQYCMSFLKEMRKELAETCNKHLDLAFEHIKRKFEYNNRFTTMTTCGYKILHSQNASDGPTPPKQILGYFLYKYLSVAVSIPTHRSCYHTFDGTMGVHQTTVPLTYTPSTSTVKFNDKDVFIFAWGNGKSRRRLYLESQNHPLPAGRRINANDIRNFFAGASQEQRNHMRENGWAPDM